MKKVVVASLLAFSAVTGMTVGTHVAFGQNPVNLGSQASSDVQMSPAEYKDYNDAISLTDPKAKAAGIEAYLTKYPQSAVKADTLQTLMLTYSSFDPTKTLDAADRLLQVDPSNLRALTFEVYFRKSGADAITDPAGKQAALDAAAGFAQKGLAATKPAKMSDADFKAVQDSANPIFYSAIGTAALNKKDSPTAIENFKKELASVPVATTQTPGPILQDTYFLGLAYLQSTPPDLLNCAFYVSRFVAFAPEPYKSQLAPTAKYCYKRFHGADDGYDAVMTAASANLNPPAGFTVTPAPTASSIATKTVAETADLGTLALSDKEFIIQNGKPEEAEKVFATIKGKSVQIPDAIVIAATDSSVQVAVSDDAVQSKTADLTFTMKEPLKTVPTVGAKITLTGTYDSYTQTPLMLTMTGGEVVEPKKAPVKKAAPVRRAAPRK
ncbi:MAG: putative lipoprotein [Acidobacteriaceae bacterium]|nr:putative lipoprotein [Acidobacteriaceae bacterium]